MASTFRLKAQTIQGIDVEKPVAQAADIAELIGASAFIVDIQANTAEFTPANGDANITVRAGQVISVTCGVIGVQDRDDFYAKFEEDGPSH